MGEKKQPGNKVIAARFKPAVVREIDAIAARMEREQKGLAVTRGDVLRMLINEAIEARKGR